MRAVAELDLPLHRLGPAPARIAELFADRAVEPTDDVR